MITEALIPCECLEIKCEDETYALLMFNFRFTKSVYI